MGYSGYRGGPERGLSRAMAERERGRRRLKNTTVAAGIASVTAVGVVAFALPGSHVKTTGSSTPGGSAKSSVTSPASSGSSGRGSGDPRSSGARGGDEGGSSSYGSSSSQGNSGSLTPPASTPVQSGGGQVTSGGTSS